MDGDIRVRSAVPHFASKPFRTPFKFGAAVVKEATFAKVAVEVENRRGQVATGWGAILLSDLWAFPSLALSHEVRDRAMRHVTERYCHTVASCASYAHPVEIFLELQNTLRGLVGTVPSEQAEELMPLLAGLVAASPVDAALHDAFGKVNGISSYDGYGPEHMHDLGGILGPAFRGRFLSEYLRSRYQERVPCFHVVGGLDPLTDAEAPAATDGAPRSLAEWIDQDGVFCFKVKLRGTDLGFDVERMVAVARTVYERHERRGGRSVYFSVDSNEQCASPAYMLEFLSRLEEQSPRAYADLLFLEQPTERDLNRHAFDMRALAARKPVIIDESLTSLEDFDRALELGWSGIALKTCKTQSLSLLLVARAVQAGVAYTVQDLTNPGMALVQSVGFAARTSPLGGVEANARQYLPLAGAEELPEHLSLVHPHDGWLCTASIRSQGLGY